MKLITLKLSMFKGIKDFELNCNGQNYNVYGDNATGKTTLKDALNWLLFDKNSADKKDFDIMRIEHGEVVHKTEPTVEAVFSMEDGRRIQLKKVYKEKWTKPRGKLNEVMSGHTTTYYINDVVKGATVYRNFINSIIDENKFKVLTEPRYFNETLSVDERKRILLDIIGGVDQAVIIGSNPDLRELGAALHGRSVEEQAAMTKTSLRATKKQIDGIAPAIRECENMKPSQDVANLGLYEAQEARVRERITLINNQIAAAKAGKVDKDLLDQYNTKCKEKVEKEKEEAGKLGAERSGLLSEVREAEQSLAVAEADLRNVQGAIAQFEMELRNCNNKREYLIREFKEEKARTAHVEDIHTVCPTCGQSLPADRVETAKRKQEKRVAAFNLERSEKLKAINEQGKANTGKITELNDRITALAAQKTALDTECRQRKEDVEKKNAALKEFDATLHPEAAEITRLRAEIADLEKQINTPAAGISDKVAALEQEKMEQQKQLAEAQENIAECKQAQKIVFRIQELKDNERALSANYVDLQKMLFLCDEYTRKLTEYIDGKVAEHFKVARFRLFKNNITNEGIEECCDTMMNGKPYESLNAAAQIKVGLDIIRTLARQYGFSAPVMIDNAESYTKLPDMEGLQIIRLIVSEDDKTLRTEQA